jgi:hypothetical protein
MPLNRFKDKRLKEIFDFISEVNKEAYKDVYLLSNQVLNKNIFINGLLDDYLEKNDIDAISFPKVIWNIILYYRNSFFRFGQYLIEKFVHYLSVQRYDLKGIKDELILIDTFFLDKIILQEGSFIDPYFAGFDKLLEKREKTYAYLPIFYSNNSIWNFAKILKQLKKENVPILTAYQLFSLNDFIRLFVFILAYPFHVLKIAYKLKNDSYIARLIKYKLVTSLHYSTMQGFCRYLHGKRLALLPCKIKIISWYENQVIHKNLYRGIREKNSKDRVMVYGCQLFLYPFSLLSINADSTEIVNNTVPDKVLVNGSYYLYDNDMIRSTVGPSFRYQKLFETKIDFEKRNNLLFVLPYYIEDINYILQVIAGMDCVNSDIIVKFHPTTDSNKYLNLIPTNVKISNENVYDLFLKAKIVIGAASGTLVEAVSLAIPAIVLRSSNKFIHNYLPEYGQGIVWDYAINANDVNKLLDKFNHKIDYEKDTLLQYAEEYKEVFFSEPTEEKIIKAFNL